MQIVDRILTCSDCGEDFIFSAGEQLFFLDKQFRNDPKHCKPCKIKQRTRIQPDKAAPIFRVETRAECSHCGIETSVPFKPTRGRPILCRACFQSRVIPTPPEQSGAST